MSNHRLPLRLFSTVSRCQKQPGALCQPHPRRQASTLTSSTEASEDADSSSSLSTPGPSDEAINSFDPIARSRSRKLRLPPSRYRVRPPKYYRGPLHPHQSPPTSSPSSRLFTPGPFTLPRLLQTYTSTLRPDLMTLSYTHFPPGQRPPPAPPRLRTWDNSSPYHLNRPARPPGGGGSALPLLRKPITFRNVPALSKITVHSLVKGATGDSAYLHVAGMVLQAITSVRCTVHRAKKTVASFGLKEGKAISLSCELKGEDMYHFLAQCVDVVMPGIKDWKGVSGKSGDGSGNIGWKFDSETVGAWPEVEVNYDAYPPKMIPVIDIIVHTTATNDKDARLLLSSLGVPFHGKHVN